MDNSNKDTNNSTPATCEDPKYLPHKVRGGVRSYHIFTTNKRIIDMTMFTKEPVVKIKATDLGLLLHAMIQANRMPEVGFADTQQSVADVLYKVNSYVKIPEKTLESLLWSANILSEMGYLDLPDGQTFSTYLINLLPEYYQYDTKYCILEHVNNSKENK